MVFRVYSFNSMPLLLFSFFFFLSSFLISAQTRTEGTGTSLETEIQNIERSIARQGVSSQDRHAGLVRLATLNQLSGDIESAARYWLDAARAIPGKIDDDALLNCAYCLAAMGEWDRAKTALEPLLSKSVRARFLNTGITAVTSNNTAALASLADNPEYASMKNEIYFLLWRLSSGTAKDRWRQRLTQEFPQSPEAFIANATLPENGQTIVLRQSPFWLFMGGLDSLSLLPAITEGRPELTQSTSLTPVPLPLETQSPAHSSFVRLQTGIFSQQANANNQAGALRQSGFTPTIEERTIGENKMWAVTVPVEQEQALKSAGIEYFPLR